MRSFARLTAAAATLFVTAALGFGLARAQVGLPRSPPPEPLPERPTAEQTSRGAERLLAGIEMTRMVVQRLLERAHDKGDAVKIDCVEDKMNIVDKRLQLAREVRQRVSAMLGAGDTERAAQELKVLDTHHEAARQSRSEAERCVDSLLDPSAASGVQYHIDDDIPEEPRSPFILLSPGVTLPELPPSSPDL